MGIPMGNKISLWALTHQPLMHNPHMVCQFKRQKYHEPEASADLKILLIPNSNSYWG